MKFDGRYTSELINNDRNVLGQTLRDIPRDTKIVMAQGYGVSPKGIPLRLLAYVVPLVRLLKQLPETARAEVYIAEEGAIRANGFDRFTVNRQARRMIHLTSEYLEKRHGIQIPILQDRYLPESSSLGSFFTLLSERVHPDNGEWNRWEAKQLKGFLGDNRRSLRYMVEHLSYMRDPFVSFDRNMSNWMLVPEMSRTMEHVIMIGGPAEKIFHKVRQKILSIYGENGQWKSHQFFTPIGKVPTYLPQMGEPLWEERRNLYVDVRLLFPYLTSTITSEYGINKYVTNDLIMLLCDAGGLETFVEAGKYRSKILKGDLESVPSSIKRALQDGWEFLRNMQSM